jgi:hypothetical protein
LPYYKKYKNKQKYQGVIADQEYNFCNLEHSSEAHENDEISSDEDVVNFEIGIGKKTKKVTKAKNKGKKKALIDEDVYNKNKKKKKAK